jgi:rhamnogalacturonyl hydrolase YesR
MRLLSSASARFSTIIVLLVLAVQATAVLSKHRYSGQDRYSTWMATSIISRGEGILTGEVTGQGDASEILKTGLMQKAFRRWLEQYPNDGAANKIRSHMRKSADSAIYAFLPRDDVWTYPLDRLSIGNTYIELYRETGVMKYKMAAKAIRRSINIQPRNEQGGLWYHANPDWSVVDGMGAFAPFYTLYTTLHDKGNTTAVPDDLLHQLDLLWEHCHDEYSGLMFHGYDYSRKAPWADANTGASPYVWSRGQALYFLGLIDTLEILPYTPEYWDTRVHIKDQFAALAHSIMEAADSKTGAWTQVLDVPHSRKNYIESSGSAIFTYALLKGVRLGYLPHQEVTPVAIRAYEYLAENFAVWEMGDNTVGYDGTVDTCILTNEPLTFDVSDKVKARQVPRIETPLTWLCSSMSVSR